MEGICIEVVLLFYHSVVCIAVVVYGMFPKCFASCRIIVCVAVVVYESSLDIPRLVELFLYPAFVVRG